MLFAAAILIQTPSSRLSDAPFGIAERAAGGVIWAEAQGLARIAAAN